MFVSITRSPLNKFYFIHLKLVFPILNCEEALSLLLRLTHWTRHGTKLNWLDIKINKIVISENMWVIRFSDNSNIRIMILLIISEFL